MAGPLWTPTAEHIAASRLQAFVDHLNGTLGTSLDVADYAGLHRFSLTESAAFWRSVWDFCGVVGEPGDTVLVDGDRMPGARFFPDAQLNFAENLLCRRDNADALVFWGEDKVKGRLSWAELYECVSRTAQALAAVGVGPGDRVAGYLPNMPETTIAMLATASLGAVWSSCSPDFGVQGVRDRFGQIAPKVLFAADGCHYNGKVHPCLDKLPDILATLITVETVVVVPYAGGADDLTGIRDAVTFDDFIAAHPGGDIPFHRHDFAAPLYIMYSSGTTGAPKCIVHGQGGALLKQLTEHVLHCDVRRDDRVFYFTTCGWMMWNWLMAGLAAGATLLLYDGSPFARDGAILWDFADAEGMTLFGTGAKYIDVQRKAGLRPRDSHDLSSVRTMTATGSPLVAEGFAWVYDAIKCDLHLASISGGTDILGCFVLGNPTAPVHAGEIQVAALGMAVDVFDAQGRPTDGKGELVCTQPFPSMPIGFWDDRNGTRYRAAYFETYPNVWHHGDFIARTQHGGYVIYGRSDATLNPGGVRIGTAEIYRQVENLDAVVEALVIGQDWDADVRVVLFVRLRDGLDLDDALIRKIKTRIRANCTPRHVPAKVVAVDDIPRTRSGKIVELAVRDVVHGRPVKNKETLANPEALALYEGIAELQTG